MSDLSYLGKQYPIRIIMVCSGNICRSPAAEKVLRHKLDAVGLEHIEVDSAGTGSWHAGDDADPRSRAAWERRGYSGAHMARQFRREWFDERELILVMDDDNFATLKGRAADDSHLAKIRYLREFDATAQDLEVPDPYYGGPHGFEDMMDFIERACDGLVEELRAP